MNLASPFSIAIVAITVLAFLGLPIGHAMIAGSILFLFLDGQDMGTAAEQLLNGLYTSYVLLAVPLFILAAELMNIGSMTERLLRFCDALVGRFRGGLAQVNIVQSIIFAGMSGSAIADAAGSGKMMQNMMTRDGKYTASYAAALTAASAVIGPIIPPSIPMVLYALVSDASIGYLFLGGVVPGLLMGLAQMAIVAITARRKNFPVEAPVPLRAFPGITVRAFPALMMPVVLLGGIYGGVMTPTEAAAVAAAYAFMISAILYRSISGRQIYESLLASARSTASIGMLIAGALVFNYVVTIENIPHTLRVILDGWDLSPMGFLILVNVILLLLGCVLEGTAILLVIVPVFIPTAQALGIDMVHFGVVVVVNIMLGLITPPYGLLLFIMTNISGSPMKDIVRDVLPFLFAMIAGIGTHHVRAGDRTLAPAAHGLSGLRPHIRDPSREGRTAPMNRPIYILNGPNLNRLGTREPEIYGTTTLAEVEVMCRAVNPALPIEFRQTNSETQLIEWVHEAIDSASGVIINPAAFSFTSLALLDALKMFRGTDHRSAPLEHPQARAALPSVSRVARRDCSDCGARRRRLSDGGRSHQQGPLATHAIARKDRSELTPKD